jgi:hypothetical protein
MPELRSGVGEQGVSCFLVRFNFRCESQPRYGVDDAYRLRLPLRSPCCKGSKCVADEPAITFSFATFWMARAWNILSVREIVIGHFSLSSSNIHSLSGRADSL